MSESVSLGLTIPEDWKWGTLGDHTSKIGSGATPRGGASVYVDEGIALVRSQNVYDHEFKSDGLARITDEAAHALRGVSLQTGDVLINITGDSILRTTVVPDAVLPARVNQHVSIVRSDGSMDPLFIQKWLSTPVMKDFMLGLSSGATRKAVTKGHLESLPIPVPPFFGQQAIAATLGALDDKIESNRRIIDYSAKLLENYSLVWGIDLPIVQLSELTSAARSTVNPVKLGSSTVDHYSLPAFDDTQLPERGAASLIKSSKLLIDRNSVLVSRLNPRIDRSWWVEIDDQLPSLASTEFACLTASTDQVLADVWLAVRNPMFQKALRNRVTGTSGSHQRVRPDDVMTINVPDFARLAPDRNRAALALLNSSSRVRHEIQHLQALRDALLPELMSGRIRVPEAREAIDEEVGDVEIQ